MSNYHSYSNTMSSNKQQKRPLYGCDTFVAFPPATSKNGMIVFGKNSDRPTGEKQSIRQYPRKTYSEKELASIHSKLKCTYIEIDQVSKTNAVLLSQIDWMYGAEMGTNEYGVVIGNEAIWTKDDCSSEPQFLLGMDLVRLGLERGNTAKQALDVITTLLEQYGQGGACAENDSSFTYHNSFMIVDQKEAWILETSGRHWVAERVTTGVRNISNCLSIRTKFDLSSKGIEEYACKMGYWKSSQNKDFDFVEAFSTSGSAEMEMSDPRFCGGQRLISNYVTKGTMDKDAMIAILRDHSSGICMHGGGFETTSSWVSQIYFQNNDQVNNHNDMRPTKVARHWVTGRPHPCQSNFEEQFVP